MTGPPALFFENIGPDFIGLDTLGPNTANPHVQKVSALFAGSGSQPHDRIPMNSSHALGTAD